MTSLSSDRSFRTSAPRQVTRPVMIQRWERLSFLHWPYEPEVVQRLLPDGLEADTFDGCAWVGIIPFRLTVRMPGFPAVPWASTFNEVNVRTYVVGPDGHRGIWFLSLDAARLGAVVVARRSYRIPYMWAQTTLEERGPFIRYRVHRRWPRKRAELDTVLERLEEVEDPTELERFLTFRWRLYSPRPLGLPADRIHFSSTDVDHPPWPLQKARVRSLEERLVEATGLPASAGEPLAHYSAGVRARFAARAPLGDDELREQVPA
jgi:uncharacterized protein YqjF (DUF2071 family)